MSSTAAEPNPPAAVPVSARPTADSAELVLQRAGYKPELRRSLRFFSMFAIAFSIISITTGIFLNYGFGLAYWGPASIWTWPIVGVGNLMVALVVAELGTRIPLAGYAYQWSARLVNPTYGWFVGFAGLLYMAVGGGAIMLQVAAPLLLSEFNVDTPSPHLVLSVAIILMLLPVVINIISIQVAARVNNVAVFTEIIGTVVFGVLLLVLWGDPLEAHPVRGGHPHEHDLRLPQPDVVRLRPGRAARRLHPGRVRAGRRHVRGRGGPPPQRAARRAVGRGRLRRAWHGRADRLHGRHPRPQDRRVGAAAAAGDRGLLAAVRAGQGLRRVRGLLDVLDPGRRHRRAGQAGLLPVAGQHAAVLRHAAEDQPAQPDAGGGAAGVRRDRRRRDDLRVLPDQLVRHARRRDRDHPLHHLLPDHAWPTRSSGAPPTASPARSRSAGGRGPSSGSCSSTPW